MNLIMSFGFSARWRRQLLALVSHAATKDVVDLMTGLGETWPYIRQCFPSATITALDYSSSMVIGAEQKNRRQFGGSITVLNQDVLASTLTDSSADLIVSAYGLKTFDQVGLAALANEVARVLRPGGYFAFIEVTQPHNRLLRALYGLYLRLVIPTVGSLLLSDPVDYRMLYRYVREFRDGETARAAFDHPLLTLTVRRHFFGCATSVSGRRR
jgi:demethylmenaquinone methyltransferase / 2-methoxy-6-polyprenyl-1,4-benzoquinol methylase